MQVLNKYKDHIPADAVYIGRGSVLGNPYVIGQHGTRLEVIEMYARWLKDKIDNRDPVVMGALKRLKSDSQLVCFCKPVPCHGDVIVKTWESLNDSKDHVTPVTDGVNHINVYSRGRTELGRLLSNLAHTPFEHDRYGKFASVEGFWYWLKSGQCHEDLRELYGYQAKKAGMRYPKVHVEDFNKEILLAIDMKLQQHPDLLKMLRESRLQLEHYYYYGQPDNCKIIRLPQYDWMMEYLSTYQSK